MTELDPALVEDAYPLQRHLGFAVTGWQADYARIELPLTEVLMNRQGLPHGGVHATLLDTAMGLCGVLHRRSGPAADGADPVDDGELSGAGQRHPADCRRLAHRVAGARPISPKAASAMTPVR